MFILGGWLDAPTFVHPPVCVYTPCTFICPHTFIHPQGCTQPPRGPPCSLCSCMVLEHCMLWGWGCFSANVYWDTPPLFGGASPLITPSHSIVGSLCIIILRDIICDMWAFPLLWKGFGGVPPSLGRLGGTSALQLFTCSFFYVFL